jgi:hypothetical protein
VSDLRQAMRAAKQARDEQENQKTIIPENNITGIPESMIASKPEEGNAESPYVNLAIRVRKRQRMHWVSEAKKQDTSLTAAIIEALNARFGTPND